MDTAPRAIICENCDRPLPDHEDCRCDADGLWFCLECFQALTEGDPVKKPDSDEIDRMGEPHQ